MTIYLVAFLTEGGDHRHPRTPLATPLSITTPPGWEPSPPLGLTPVFCYIPIWRGETIWDKLSCLRNWQRSNGPESPSLQLNQRANHWITAPLYKSVRKDVSQQLMSCYRRYSCLCTFTDRCYLMGNVLVHEALRPFTGSVSFHNTYSREAAIQLHIQEVPFRRKCPTAGAAPPPPPPPYTADSESRTVSWPL